jgi:adenylate cyclase class IV
MIENEIKVFGESVECMHQRLVQNGFVHTDTLVQPTNYYGGIRCRMIANEKTGTIKYEICKKIKMPSGVKKEYLDDQITRSEYLIFKNTLSQYQKATFDGVKNRYVYNATEYPQFTITVDVWNKEVFPIPYMEIESHSEFDDPCDIVSILYPNMSGMACTRDGIRTLVSLFKAVNSPIGKILSCN